MAHRVPSDKEAFPEAPRLEEPVTARVPSIEHDELHHSRQHVPADSHKALEVLNKEALKQAAEAEELLRILQARVDAIAADLTRVHEHMSRSELQRILMQQDLSDEVHKLRSELHLGLQAFAERFDGYTASSADSAVSGRAASEDEYDECDGGLEAYQEHDSQVHEKAPSLDTRIDVAGELTTGAEGPTEDPTLSRRGEINVGCELRGEVELNCPEEDIVERERHWLPPTTSTAASPLSTQPERHEVVMSPACVLRAVSLSPRTLSYPQKSPKAMHSADCRARRPPPPLQDWTTPARPTLGWELLPSLIWRSSCPASQELPQCLVQYALQHPLEATRPPALLARRPASAS